MKTFKQSLHIWITTASLMAFLTGWGTLAHAPKPAAALTASTTVATQTVTNAESPLQVVQNLLNLRTHTRNHNRSNSSVALRTGGS